MNQNTASPGSNYLKSSDFGDDLGSMVDRSLRLDGTPPRRWPRNPLYQPDSVSQLQPAPQIPGAYHHSPERQPVQSTYSGHYAAQPPASVRHPAVPLPSSHGQPPVPQAPQQLDHQSYQQPYQPPRQAQPPQPQPYQQSQPQQAHQPHQPQEVHQPQTQPLQFSQQSRPPIPQTQPQQYVSDYGAPAPIETAHAISYGYEDAQRSPSSPLSPLSDNSSNYSSPVSSPAAPPVSEPSQAPQRLRSPVQMDTRSHNQASQVSQAPQAHPAPQAPQAHSAPQPRSQTHQPPVPVPRAQSPQEPISTAGHSSPRSPSHVPVRQGDHWNQDGAATLVRKTTDEQGNVTTRVIKKGVEDFDFKDELGTGSYSTVVAACDKQTLRQYAIKILDKTHIIKEDKVKYVEIEKNTLTRLGDHPGIIHLYYTFQDRTSLFFVLDYAPNGELLHLVKKMGSLDEACARYYAAQLLDAIEYMHSKGVIHRDLKPENILLDYKMRIKITDFGTAKLLQRDASTGEYPTDSCRATSFVGTAEYVSPELLSAKAQGKATDIWAFGCVLYQMIAGSPPFQGSTQYLTFQRIVRFQYNIPPGFPYMVRDLVKGIFVNPRRRLSADQIKEHPFFEGQDWSAKALWNTAPPRLAPYRPTPSSMSANSRPGQRRQPARPTPQLVPTADGLRHAQPQTRAGIPTRAAPRLQSQQPQQQPQQQISQPKRQSPTDSPVGLGIGQSTSGPGAGSNSSSRPPERPRPSAAAGPPRSAGVSASSAAAAALRGPSAQRSRQASSTQHSATYQQSQERLQALTRAVREQRTGSRPSPPLTLNTQVGQSGSAQSGQSAPSAQAQAAARGRAAPAATASPRTPGGGASTPPLGGHHLQSVSSPRSPALPTPQMTTLEGEWSSALISSSERILRIGPVMVHMGPNNREHHAGDLETPEERESRLQKLFSPRKKKRLLMVTTAGRMLVIGEDRKVRFEIPLGVPQVEVRVVSSARKGSSSLVVETYNRVLTIDDDEKSVAEWLKTVDLSKRFYAQATAEQERNAFSAAAAAALAVSGGRR